MAAQINYSFSTPKGIAGGLYDISDHDIVTRMNDEADGNISYGVAAVVGKSKGQSIKLPVVSSAKADFEGIVIHAANTEQDMKGKTIVKNGASLGIVKKGNVWGKIVAGCVPEYKKTAYMVVDGDYRGMFTNNSAAYSLYEKCDSATSGAKKIVADTATPESSEIKLSNVTPVVDGYVPAENDYVVFKQIHGDTVDIGVIFGVESDTENSIAVIEIK